MPRVDLVVESELSRSSRVRQLEAMFDVPAARKSRCEWHFDVPLDDKDWHVGLIVGPSGSGKSSVARELFGRRVDVRLRWTGKSVIDDFRATSPMEAIADVCKAVGFNTIPAWLRPFKVLSTGERFRVELARRLLELEDPIVVDEFTSVVDRQVAKIGANAVQKYVRRHRRQFVGVSCHYDVIDWLQPDWILEPATGKFARRSVQPRPGIEIEIRRVDHSAWKLFAPFHYLTGNLHRNARCFVLFVEGRPAAFGGVLHRVHWGSRNIRGLSRMVTLPDWQGLGLAFHLMGALGAAYKGLGYRFHTYPAHPSFIRSFDRSPEWGLIRRPASFNPTGRRSMMRLVGKSRVERGDLQRRPCATFRYVGDAMNPDEAGRLTGMPPFS